MPNADEMLDRLFRAARNEAPGGASLEFAFETRVMARLRDDASAGLFTWAWKLAPFFAALAVAAGLWSRSASAQADAIATLISEASRTQAEAALVSYLTGGR
jgi:hypothetical protein